MQPYYADESCTIYLGDCREVLPTLADDSVDVVLSDPPYFRVKGEWWDRQWKTPEAFLAWLSQVSADWHRVMRPNASLYCFASPEMSARVEVVIRGRFNVLNRIRWMKAAGWHQKAEREALRRFLSPWEEVIFAEPLVSDAWANGESGWADATRELHKKVYSPIGDYIRTERERAGFTRNEVEVALGYVMTTDPTRGTALCCRWEEGSSLPTKDAYDRLRAFLNGRGGEYLRTEYEDLRTEYEDLRRPFVVGAKEEATDLWKFATVAPGPGKHPCEKPLALLRYAPRKSSNPNAVVLDSFMGSGSTLVAAKELGRRAIGIDIMESHCAIAATRLSQEVLPLGAA